MKLITILLIFMVGTVIFATGKETDSFEKDASGWIVKKSGDSKLGNAEVRIDKTNAKTGNSSLCIIGEFKDKKKYVSIRKDFGENLNVSGIKFWIKTPSQNQIAVRAKDAKNQTHHIRVYFPPSKLKDWQEVVINDFSKEANKKSYAGWGGPKDGKVYLPIKRIYIILPNKSEKPVIWIDDVEIIRGTTKNTP
jgi:hypothetical protein